MSWLKVVMLSLAVVCVSGCAAVVVGAAAGAGGFAYVNGEMTGTQPASLDQTWAAAQTTMQELQFPILTKSKDGAQAELTAKDSKGTKITLHLKRLSDTATDARVRVGVFGDQTLSRTILDKIRAHVVS